MQSESEKTQSSGALRIEILKLIHAGTKETFEFFNGPAYSQQMANTRTFLWLSYLILSSIFGLVFFLENRIYNAQISYVFFSLGISVLTVIPCIVLCVLQMRRNNKMLAHRFTDFTAYYIDKQKDHFGDDQVAYENLLRDQIKAYDFLYAQLREDTEKRGQILRKVRVLVIVSFCSFVLSLVFITAFSNPKMTEENKLETPVSQESTVTPIATDQAAMDSVPKKE